MEGDSNSVSVQCYRRFQNVHFHCSHIEALNVRVSTQMHGVMDVHCFSSASNATAVVKIEYVFFFLLISTAWCLTTPLASATPITFAFMDGTISIAADFTTTITRYIDSEDFAKKKKKDLCIAIPVPEVQQQLHLDQLIVREYSPT